MKRLFALPCAFMLVLLLSAAAHAEWTPINDELEIDYQSQVLRIFVAGKNEDQMSAFCRKLAFDYVGTLMDGKDNIKIADIFKTRKVMLARVQAQINKSMRYYSTTRLDDGTLTRTCIIELQFLKELFPEINMPTP